MKQCSLCLCGMICTCGKQDENVVLTPNMLRENNPVGEKVLSIVAFIAYVHVILSCKAYLEVQMFVHRVFKSKSVPNICIHVVQTPCMHMKKICLDNNMLCLKDYE